MHKGFTLWFTGLPSSGKSTLAREVEDILLERGVNVEVLDGDEVRENLSKGLGFSKEDRDTNIRRIGYVCKLLSRNGAVAISAAISPYKSIRDEVRGTIENFVECYVRTPLEVAEARDVKGLYKKARAGEIKEFTGVSDPYEEPDKAEIVIDSDKESVDESTAKIIRTLEMMEFIPEVAGKAAYSADDDAEIKKRLEDLGYI